jgi:hypothetical protein
MSNAILLAGTRARTTASSKARLPDASVASRTAIEGATRNIARLSAKADIAANSWLRFQSIAGHVTAVVISFPGDAT